MIFKDLPTSEVRDRLLRLIRERSYLEGDFTLTSGKKSDYFIDLKPTSLHPEGAALIGELVVRTLKDLSIEPDAVGGLTLGADPLATSVSLTALGHGLSWPAFIVRKESKGHGTDQYIEGKKNLPERGRVVILEDVTSTGGSSLKAVERAQAEGYRVEAVLTVIDREMGGKEKVEGAGLRFIPLGTISNVRTISI